MRFAADENFDSTILKGLRRRLGNIDVVRVQDTELYSESDPIVLEWAAKENRIVLTHDVQTLVNDAYERIRQGLPMPGVILVPHRLAVGVAIDDLEIAIGAGSLEDFKNKVVFIPL